MLQVLDVGLRLEIGIALDHREQRPNRGARGVRRDGLIRDWRGRRVRGARLGHFGQDVMLEGHDATNGRYEVRKLIVALLQDHVDVGPGFVDPLP